MDMQNKQVVFSTAAMCLPQIFTHAHVSIQILEFQFLTFKFLKRYNCTSFLRKIVKNIKYPDN